jgi:hypothetical protein
MATATAPAQAAAISCSGSSVYGSASTGIGANCGYLGAGDRFRIDITQFFSGLGTPSFNNTPIGIGVMSSGGSSVSFENLSVVGSGYAGGKRFTFRKPGIFGAAPTSPLGSATKPGFAYTTNGPRSKSLGGYGSVNFAFGADGPGAFASLTGAPAQAGLSKIDKAFVVGRLASVGNQYTNNVVSFGITQFNAQKSTPAAVHGGHFTTEVPGPLPIAGAGAAFTWSRKLRRRQRLAASAVSGG